MWGAFSRAPPPASASLRSPKVAADNNSSSTSSKSKTSTNSHHHQQAKKRAPSSTVTAATTDSSSSSSTTILPNTNNNNNSHNKETNNTSRNHDYSPCSPVRRRVQLDEEDESHVTRLMENLTYACSPVTTPGKGGSQSTDDNVEVLLASIDRQFRRQGEECGDRNRHHHRNDLGMEDDDDDEEDDLPDDLVGRIGDFVSESLASMLEQTQLTMEEADRQLTQDEGDDDDDYDDNNNLEGCYYDGYNNDDASTVHPDLATSHCIAQTPPRHPASSSSLHRHDPALWTMNSPLAHTPAVMMVEDEEDLQLKEQVLAKFSQSGAMDEQDNDNEDDEQEEEEEVEFGDNANNNSNFSNHHNEDDANHHHNDNNKYNEDDDDDQASNSVDQQTCQMAKGWVLSPVSSDLTPATVNRPPDPPATHILNHRVLQEQTLLDHVQESADDNDEDDGGETIVMDFYETREENVAATADGPGYKKIVYHIVNKGGDEQTVVIEEEGEEAILTATESEHQDTEDDEDEDHHADEEMDTPDEQDDDNVEEKETDEDDDYTTNTYHPFISGDTSVGMATTATPTLPLLQHQDRGAFSPLQPPARSPQPTTSPQPPAPTTPTTTTTTAAPPAMDDKEEEEDGEVRYISRPLVTDMAHVDADLHKENLDRYATMRAISNDDNVMSPTNHDDDQPSRHPYEYETEEDDGRALTTTASSATDHDLNMTDSLDSWLNQMKSKSFTTDDDSSRESPRKRRPSSGAAATHDYGDATPIPEEEGEDDDDDDDAILDAELGVKKSAGPKSRGDGSVSFRSTKSFATYATNRSIVARSVKTVPVRSSPPAFITSTTPSTSRLHTSTAAVSAAKTFDRTNATVDSKPAVVSKKQVVPITTRSSTTSTAATRLVPAKVTKPATATKSLTASSATGVRTLPTKPFPGGIVPTNVVRKTIRPTAKPESNILPRRPRTVTIEVSNRLLVGTAASRGQTLLTKEKATPKQPEKPRVTPSSTSVVVKPKTPAVRKSNVCGVGSSSIRLLKQQAAARGEVYRPPPTLVRTASSDSSQKNLRVSTATPVSSRLLRPTAASLAQRICSDSVSPTASSISRGTLSSLDSYGFGVRKPTTIVKSTSMKRMATAAPPRPNSQPKPRVITTAKSPCFATNAKYGSGTSSGTSHKPRPDAPTLAQSHNVLQKCLRDISPSDSSARSHTLTVPRSPNLHTTSRLRDKKVLDISHQHNHGPIKEKDDIPMANSTDFLMRGLRDGGPAVSVPVKRDGKLTVPVTPKFHTIHKRAAVKSHEEADKEIMEYNNSHPFKALPMPASSSASSANHHHNNPNPVPHKPHRPTEPVPFHFHTAERHRTLKPEEPSGQRASSNTRARPTPETARPLRTIAPTAPKLATSARSVSREAAREASERRAEELMREKQQLAAKRQRERHLEEMAKAAEALPHVKTTTLVQPFNFHSDRPKSGESARDVSERLAEELRLERQLLTAKRLRERQLEAHAKASGGATPPPPTGKSVVSSPASSSPTKTVAKTVVKPFTLHTNRPSSSYQALKEASERRADALMREKQELAAKRAREKHLVELKTTSRTVSSPLKTKVEPFSLQTDQRHAKYEKLLLENKRRQEEEDEKMTKFRARPCPETTYREPTITAAITTPKEKVDMGE